MRVPDPSVFERPSEPSPDSIAEIATKIKQQRFSRNDVTLWLKRGAQIGATIGGLCGAILWLFFRTNRRVLFPTNMATAVFYFALLGSAIGSAIGCVAVGIIKPIIAAIFWDVERYEREYGTGGPRPAGGTNRSRDLR
jgi:hypothetical protein